MSELAHTHSVLLLPGWNDSDAQHWQSHWERDHGYQRVQQHDWARPRSGDWLARLDEVVLLQAHDCPIVLVAHSLGCQLVARWAAHSRHAARVQAALLVAPPDTETLENQHLLPGWSPMPRQPLPFRALLVASRNDPFCSFARAQALAGHWQADLVDAGEAGHINTASALGAWPQGHRMLLDWMQEHEENTTTWQPERT